ncbi:MAG: helix-hairpin-helix domain-containing protein [Eubacterium sp.]|nr:helix-hairpin-helix domain-containing protein [Eubacterium sp.]
MNNKNRIQVVLMVAAVFLCGIGYIVFGPGRTAAKPDGDAEGFVAGEGKPVTAEDKTVAADTASGEVYVYICGAVKKPGVYTFDHLPRLSEVVDDAGGFTKKADVTSVNLAMQLSDGAQIVVAAKGERTEAAGGTGQASQGAADNPGATSSADKININTAAADDLMRIPGIGEAKAALIISYRSEHGSFSKPEDLMQISGIKEGIFARIKDYICV